MSKDKGSEVGYCRPPTATRFKPGQSGNPRGRPRGSRSLNAAVVAAANERVLIVENGRRRSISKLDAAVKQLTNKAASGDPKATNLLLTLLQNDEAKRAPEATAVPDDDRAVMERLTRRFVKDLDKTKGES